MRNIGGTCACVSTADYKHKMNTLENTINIHICPRTNSTHFSVFNRIIFQSLFIVGQSLLKVFNRNIAFISLEVTKIFKAHVQGPFLSNTLSFTIFSQHEHKNQTCKIINLGYKVINPMTHSTRMTVKLFALLFDKNHTTGYLEIQPLFQKML